MGDSSTSSGGVAGLLKGLLTWRGQLLLQCLINFGGIVFIVSGLSSALVYCNSAPTAMLDAFKPDDRPYALTRVANFGHFTCGTYWRFQWTCWSLQVVWLILVIVAWWRDLLAQSLALLTALAGATTAWHFWNADDLVHLYNKTQGTLWNAGIVSFLGLVAVMISNFLILFSAGGLVHAAKTSGQSNGGTV